MTSLQRTLVVLGLAVLATACSSSPAHRTATTRPAAKRPGQPATAPPGVQLGERVAVDPSTRPTGDAVIESMVPVGRARVAVAAFVLPCQRIHAVTLHENSSTVELGVQLGTPKASTTAPGPCTSTPTLVHTVVRLASPLGGRHLVQARPVTTSAGSTSSSTTTPTAPSSTGTAGATGATSTAP